MNVSASLKAKGKGKLRIGAIHKRWSRLEMDNLLWVDSVLLMRNEMSLYIISIQVI